jgi:hypothetical protein
MDVTISRAGLVLQLPGRSAAPRKPRTLASLLGHWQATVERIEDGYTLGDLIELLGGVRGIDTLTRMLGCDVAGLLAEAELGPLPRNCDHGAILHHLRVENRLEPSNYVPHPEDPPHEDFLELVRSGSEIVLGQRHGFWTGPYKIYRDVVAWGEGRDPQSGEVENRFMVEFEGVRKLLDLPLRYSPEAVFSDSLHGETGGFTTAISITFGEFVTAIMSVVGRFGSEDEREETLRSMLADDEADGGGKPDN